MAHKNQQQSNSSDSPMARLLASQKSSFKTLHKRDLIKGIVTKLTSKEILIDIQAKTEAVVLEKDKKILRNILDSVTLGDEVEVSVLNPESDLGHPVVSLRRFMENRVWNKLADYQKKKQSVTGVVRDVTRGGYLLETQEGTIGFLPNSQISFAKLNKNTSDSGEGNHQDIIGKSLDVFILELNRIGKKIIFSQKPVMGVEEFEKKIGKLTVGQKTSSIVTNITTFGVFVTLPDYDNIDGLIHISEISWDKVENLGSLFSVGQVLEVVVIGIDREAKRVELSIRKLTADPFDELVKNIAIDQKLEGVISKVISTGVIIEFAQDALKTVEGLIRKEKIPPTTIYEIGQPITVSVSEFDKKRHRILLTPILKEKPIGYR